MAKGSFLDWFKWESKSKREKRERVYYGRMFPLGKEQQEWERETLRQLFPEYSKKIEEVHFALLTLREAINNSKLDEEDEEYETLEEGIQEWMKSGIIMGFAKKGYVPTIRAMAALEDQADDISKLPTVEEIKAAADEFYRN